MHTLITYLEYFLASFSCFYFLASRVCVLKLYCYLSNWSKRWAFIEDRLRKDIFESKLHSLLLSWKVVAAVSYQWDSEERINQCCIFSIRASQVKWIVAFHLLHMHRAYQFSELMNKTEYLLEKIQHNSSIVMWATYV